MTRLATTGDFNLIVGRERCLRVFDDQHRRKAENHKKSKGRSKKNDKQCRRQDNDCGRGSNEVHTGSGSDIDVAKIMDEFDLSLAIAGVPERSKGRVL